jgi:hypothetical protein
MIVWRTILGLMVAANGQRQSHNLLAGFNDRRQGFLINANNSRDARSYANSGRLGGGANLHAE